MAKQYSVETEETTDLNYAAFLVASGFKFLEPPTPHGRYILFTFKKTQELEEAKFNYFNRNAKVDALTFGEAIRSLFALQRKGGGINE